MSKKRKFRIGQTKPSPFDFKQSLTKIAQQYMYAQHKLNPLIIEQHLGVDESIVLIACYTDAVIAGKEHSPSHKMSEKDIIGASNLLIHLWKIGLFKPSADFPFTLNQLLQQMEDEETGHE